MISTISTISEMMTGEVAGVEDVVEEAVVVAEAAEDSRSLSAVEEGDSCL